MRNDEEEFPNSPADEIQKGREWISSLFGSTLRGEDLVARMLGNELTVTSDEFDERELEDLAFIEMEAGGRIGIITPAERERYGIHAYRVKSGYQ